MRFDPLDAQAVLACMDDGSLWPADRVDVAHVDPAVAYQTALALRALRMARGEQPRGYKLGFTNRSIWPRYDVSAPMWGEVWKHTLQFCDDGAGTIDLAHTCQPRIEPECVFGLKAKPPPDATLDDLFDCLDWAAPGFEVVQSHCAAWKFVAPESIADGGLHARLLVGARRPVREIAASAAEFESELLCSSVTLYRDGEVVDGGIGANVLDGPLHALQQFLRELRGVPGAPDLQAGQVVTTGTWTDAWPVLAGQRWRAEFDGVRPPLATLSVECR